MICVPMGLPKHLWAQLARKKQVGGGGSTTTLSLLVLLDLENTELPGKVENI